MVNKGYVRTVTGDIPGESLGLTLCHEHLSLNMHPLYPADYVLTDLGIVSHELERVKAVGFTSIVDCGTQEHHRDPVFLKTLADRTGMHVIACTGFYREDLYIDVAKSGSVDDVEKFMLDEVESGIGGTGIRAGAIGEIDSGAEGVSPLQEKVFVAAARVQQKANVAILTHTAEGKGALAQLDVLLKAGASPDRILVGHLDCLADPDLHEEVAKRGAFVGYDRVGALAYQSDEVRAQMFAELVRRGLTDHLILSQDTAGLHKFEGRGGQGYSYLMKTFVPMLHENGVDDATITRVLKENPRRLLAGNGHVG
jgi:phosphotriesterase-related protein